ncbi:protein translocase subunit SecD [candidate division WOR-3 bacterium]|nr:protein translocase subunit SecD [candidate division WOR-3 bacterium]
MKGIRVKFIGLLVVFALSIWALYPTYRLYSVLPKQEKALKDRLTRATSSDDSAQVAVEVAELQNVKAGVHKRSLNLGLDIVGGMQLTLEVDKSKLSADEAADAGDRALEVIRNRVDQFGVFEPVIQKVGRDRILVQLPGVDRERAKNLIGQTAQLKFQLVQEERATYDALKTLDDKLKSPLAADTTRQTAKSDTAKKVQADTARLAALFDTARMDTGLAVTGQPEEGTLLGYVRTIGGDFAVDERDYLEFKARLALARPSWPAGYEFLFGPSEVHEGGPGRRLYLLKTEPEMLGSAIKDARPAPYQGSEPGLANTWIVSLKLGRKDAAVFAQVTGRNIGRRLAIVLDNVVKSAPVIQSRIPDGNAMITTNDVNPDESRDLAIVLRSGALPAPVNIVEERSVGASLGSDSIRRGILAAVVGSLAVVLFMIIYYSVGGVLAVFALVLNIFFLLAVLAGLRATLTLPGLAGIALTIGMAVDANVLVFERIREEMRSGKTNLAAVDTGYARAFVTIIDSNATTIITAIALYFVGTGAIRGFAITLTAGLFINVLTAVFVTRWIFDWWLSRFHVGKLRV